EPVEGGGGRRGGVVPGVGRGEGNRQRARRPSLQHGAGGRGVDERAGHARRGVELRRTEGRAVGDVRGRRPGEDRRRLQHIDRNGGRRDRVVRCVVGGEGDRQRPRGAGVQDRAGRRGVHGTARRT